MGASETLAQLTWTTWWEAYLEGFAVIFGPKLLLTLICLTTIVVLGLLIGTSVNMVSSDRFRAETAALIVLTVAADAVMGISAVSYATDGELSLGMFLTKYGLGGIYISVAGTVLIPAMLFSVLIGVLIGERRRPHRRR